MHIKRIAIPNFRNFEDIDLDDLPACLVLVGENGSGKSNLLYALRLVLDASLPDTARELELEDFWLGLAKPFDGNVISVSVDLTDYASDVKAKALLADSVVSEAPLVSRLTFEFRPRSDAAAGASGPDSYEWMRFGGNRPRDPVHRNVLRFVSLRVLPALRDGERVLASGRSPLRRLLADLTVDPSLVAAVDAATQTA